MRPVTIPADLVPDGCKRYVISAPDGDLTSTDVGAVEVFAGIDDRGFRLTLLVALEPGDLERLQAQHREHGAAAVWLTMYTPQLPVFAVEIADGQG